MVKSTTERDSVATPPYILDSLEKEYGKKFFDPCPLNPHFDKDKDVDGLSVPWKDFTYVNPPYSNVRPWLQKAQKENALGKTIVLLLKVDTLATNYFKQYTNDVELRFFNHRIKFPNYSRQAMFCSMLVIFGKNKSSSYKIIDYRS